MSKSDGVVEEKGLGRVGAVVKAGAEPKMNGGCTRVHPQIHLCDANKIFSRKWPVRQFDHTGRGSMWDVKSSIKKITAFFQLFVTT